MISTRQFFVFRKFAGFNRISNSLLGHLVTYPDTVLNFNNSQDISQTLKYINFPCTPALLVYGGHDPKLELLHIFM